MSSRILEGPKPTQPVQDKSLGHFLFNCCTKYSNRICQIDGTTNISETYASVKQRSIRLAIALQKRKILPGDVIAVCSENTLDNSIPIIATVFLGASVANLDPALSMRQTKHLLRLVTPKIVFVGEAFVKLIEDSLEGENIKTEIVVFGFSSRYASFSTLVQHEEKEDEFLPVNVDPEDVALMLFSSGTTGSSKAICHCHRNIFRLIDHACYMGWDKDVMHFTSFYWLTAFLIFLGCFNRGNYRVFCRNDTAEEIFRIIETHRVKSMFMAPVLTFKLTRFENPNNYDTSSLKILSVGGSPIPSSQMEKLRSIFPNTLTTMLYGMTETGVISAFHPFSDFNIANQKICSSGKLVPECKLKVVDSQSGKLLLPNQKGEICVWSPSLMKGYYKIDSSHTFDKYGFLKTGDEGYYDEDGFIYVIERLKEMFKYRSWHIIPSTLESVLLEHPVIQEAVVFGLPDDEDGEVPAACVILKSGCTLKEEEIDEFLRERVADRERLRAGVTFVKSLPKTPTGKVVRREVRNFVVNALRNK